MTTGKKVLNGFGIFFGIILSIVLVLNLIVAPILLSTLSLVTPKTITNALENIDATQFLDISEQDAESEAISSLLSSKAAKEVISLYATDVINSLGSKPAEAQLTADALKTIIEENIDEIVNIVKLSADDADITDEQIKQQIETTIADGADEILASLPNPKDLVAQITEQNPEIQMLLNIVGNAKRIKAAIIGEVVLISALVFVCRLYKFKGVRWLSVDLFVATGIMILVCAALALGSGAVSGLAGSESEIVGVIVGSVASSLTTGVVIRTGVMLFAAIGLMVASVFIKKAINKKAEVIAIPVEEVPAVEQETETPAEQQEQQTL